MSDILGTLNTFLYFARSCIKRSKRNKAKVILDKKGAAQGILTAIHKTLGAFPRLNYNVLFAP